MLRKQLLRPEGSIDTTKIFTEKELKIATNNFDESKIIGRGGYGTVYKAELPDQRVVAIKKSKIVGSYRTINSLMKWWYYCRSITRM